MNNESKTALAAVQAYRQSSKALEVDVGHDDQQAQRAAQKAADLGFNEETRSNKAFVLSKVAQSVGLFEHASDELKSDRGFVQEVVRLSPLGMFFASTELKNDREYIASLIDLNPEVIRFASLELRSDVEIAAQAVSMDCSTLRYVSNELFSSKEFLFAIHEALLDSGNQAKFASDRNFQIVTERWKIVQEIDDLGKLSK